MADLPSYVPANHVIDGIYISGWRATMFAEVLRECGITNVLKLFPDIPYFPEDFNVLENALDDGVFVPQEKLQRGVGFILEQVNAEKPVLVMCGAGISRSATFVLGALLERGHDLHDAFVLLREKRPIVGPHPQMWQSLIIHYQLDYTLEDAWRWMGD